MKALIQIIIPILSIICFNDCCSVNKIVGKSFCVHLELQNGFDNDSIVVMIDGNQNIIVDSVSTMMMLGWAKTEEVYLSSGNHLIKILLPKDNVASDTSFVIECKQLWIGINYNQNKNKIGFNISERAPRYL